MKLDRRQFASLAAVCLLATACSNGTGGGAADSKEPVAADADAGDGTDEGSADGPDDEQAGDGATSIELDERLDHENGSTMTVTGIELEGNGVLVSFEAYNGFTQPIKLALFGDEEGGSPFVQLVDDAGREYRFQPPADNPALELEPNAEMDARIAFTGRLSDGATSVTLRLGYNSDLNVPLDGGFPQHSTNPSFVFEDLPLPGR